VGRLAFTKSTKLYAFDREDAEAVKNQRARPLDSFNASKEP